MSTVRTIGCALLLLWSLGRPNLAGAQGQDLHLKCGVIPITDVAPLYLGIAHGFFSAEHLTVEPIAAQSGSAIVASVVGGDNDIGFSNTVSLLLAAAHGIPISFIAYGSGINDGRPAAAVMVAGSSDIKTYRDLSHKTIAVNAINNIGDVTINDVLARNGVDPSSVRYVEMSFSAMPAALQAGRVDAIWANEPFLSSARLQGARVLFSNYEEYDPNLTVAMYFTSTAFAAQHPNAVLRFARAMDKAEAYAQSHPAETRRVLAQYTQLDAATASTIALAGWHAPISVGSIRKLEQSMIARKLLQGPVDINALLAPYRAAVGSRP